MNVKELNNCRQKKKMTNGPEHYTNSFLHLNAKELKEHCTSEVATVEVWPAEETARCRSYCIAFEAHSVEELLHAELAAVPAFADSHHPRGYCGSGGWYIRCSTLACYSSAKSKTVACAIAEGLPADAVAVAPEDGYKLRVWALYYCLQEQSDECYFLCHFPV